MSRAGVSERRVSELDVDAMGAIAAKKAIGDKPPPDLIINASGVPKQTIPDTSVFIQNELGYEGIPSFSVHSTCLSFITAINVAGSLIQSNAQKHDSECVVCTVNPRISRLIVTLFLYLLTQRVQLPRISPA